MKKATKKPTHSEVISIINLFYNIIDRASEQKQKKKKKEILYPIQCIEEQELNYDHHNHMNNI